MAEFTVASPYNEYKYSKREDTLKYNKKLERDALLYKSDQMMLSDRGLSDAKVTEWETYRQKLRDIPQDWADAPNPLIRYPQAPNGEYRDTEIAEPDLDPETGEAPHKIIRIADRTAADDDAIGMLTPVFGINE